MIFCFFCLLTDLKHPTHPTRSVSTKKNSADDGLKANLVRNMRLLLELNELKRRYHIFCLGTLTRTGTGSPVNMLYDDIVWVIRDSLKQPILEQLDLS